MDSYDYQFNNQRNDYKSNAFGKSVADTLSYDNGIHSADNKINVGADKSQEAFGKPAKIGSFEDLDDQVVIHPNGALEGGDGARQMLSTRGGKQYSRY